MPLVVFVDFLCCCQTKNDEERNDGDISSCGTDPGDLLQQSNTEEEDIGISSKLFKEKLRNEGNNIILCC